MQTWLRLREKSRLPQGGGDRSQSGVGRSKALSGAAAGTAGNDENDEEVSIL